LVLINPGYIPYIIDNKGTVIDEKYKINTKSEYNFSEKGKKSNIISIKSDKIKNGKIKNKKNVILKFNFFSLFNIKNIL
jgi:hypothetical protein